MAINTEKERLMGYWSTPACSEEIRIAAEANFQNRGRSRAACGRCTLWQKEIYFVYKTAAEVLILRMNIKIVDRGCEDGFDLIWFEQVNKQVKGLLWWSGELVASI